MLVDDLRAAIRAGACVRMGFADGCRVWWLDHPYTPIDDATVCAAMFGPNGGMLLEEAFDSLFGWEGNSQTWVSVYA